MEAITAQYKTYKTKRKQQHWRNNNKKESESKKNVRQKQLNKEDKAKELTAI